MAIKSSVASSSLVEVLDRILDKGIVIDLWARVSLVGIELLTIEARIVVASVETWLVYGEYWDTVQSCLETLDLQWDHVNLYHDSVLADGPLGRQMVQNLAASGSYDFALVLKLLDKGAILHKTEDIDLLLAEYRVAAGYERPTREAASLALQRDVYIAQRIATTVPPGGAGLLVIGAAHEVEKHLPGGIRLVYLP